MGGGGQILTLIFDYSNPNQRQIADNIWQAQKAGHPTRLLMVEFLIVVQQLEGFDVLQGINAGVGTNIPSHPQYRVVPVHG